MMKKLKRNKWKIKVFLYTGISWILVKNYFSFNSLCMYISWLNEFIWIVIDIVIDVVIAWFGVDVIGYDEN